MLISGFHFPSLSALFEDLPLHPRYARSLFTARRCNFVEQIELHMCLLAKSSFRTGVVIYLSSDLRPPATCFARIQIAQNEEGRADPRILLHVKSASTLLIADCYVSIFSFQTDGRSSIAFAAVAVAPLLVLRFRMVKEGRCIHSLLTRRVTFP